MEELRPTVDSIIKSFDFGTLKDFKFAIGPKEDMFNYFVLIFN
jgi:hypothetical protein